MAQGVSLQTDSVGVRISDADGEAVQLGWDDARLVARTILGRAADPAAQSVWADSVLARLTVAVRQVDVELAALTTALRLAKVDARGSA